MKRSALITGCVYIDATCVEPLGLVNELIHKGFFLRDIECIDELTVRILCEESECSKLQQHLQYRGCEHKVTKRIGWRLEFGEIFRRSVLLMVVGLVLFATMFLPTRILFIQVVGNEMISSESILDAAQTCGVHFFASRKQVRSEKTKNELMNTLTQLQWAGINTSGCVATIQVKEKKTVNENSDHYPFGNIVASRDGIIYRCTVKEGELRCKVGQAVLKDQLLVSGYRESGISVSQKNVDAEIYGITERNISIVAMCSYEKRDAAGESKIRYSLRIGKKIIKLSKGSGIYPHTCAKIYVEEYMSLPGGFRLPVSIICEKTIPYKVQAGIDDGVESFSWLSDFGQDYISRQMIAGTVLHRQETVDVIHDMCSYQARYACVELIGKNKFEGIIKQYGENE